MELLNKKNVRILERAREWREAVKLSVEPLEEQGFVTPEYKDAIISNVEEMGPYIVLAPNIAMPHARPEQGAVKSQIAVTLFQNPVAFERRDTSAKLFITLAASDSESHLSALVSISEILQNDTLVEEILHAPDEEMLYHYFEGGRNKDA